MVTSVAARGGKQFRCAAPSSDIGADVERQ